jgi:hypothetical protein
MAESPMSGPTVLGVLGDITRERVDAIVNAVFEV